MRRPLKKGPLFGFIFFIALVLILLPTYNGLVSLYEDVSAKWSQVENQLQRRADLIPNLVSTVKGYAAHEEKIFSEVAEARSRLLGAQGPAQAADANTELSSALGRLLAISEAYPQLKADSNFIQLQDELAGTENRIAVSRKDYNETVQVFNTKIKRFPTNVLVKFFGFKAKDYFKADEGAAKVPEVKF